MRKGTIILKIQKLLPNISHLESQKKYPTATEREGQGLEWSEINRSATRAWYFDSDGFSLSGFWI